MSVSRGGFEFELNLRLYDFLLFLLWETNVTCDIVRVKVNAGWIWFIVMLL